MKRTLLILFTAGALTCWSAAQAQNPEEKSEHKSATQQDKDANNPNGNVTITEGPNVTTTENSASIQWKTSGRAATIVKYGTDANNLSERSNQPGGSRFHNVTLGNLSPGTTYHFAIMTDDNTVRQTGEFQTKGASSASSGTAAGNPGSVTITSGPTVSAQSTTATITWTTDKNAANEIRYGTDANNLSQHWYEPGGERQHSATLNNLQPGQTYTFAIMTREGTERTRGQFQTSGTASATTPTTATAAATGSVNLTAQPNILQLGDRAATIHWTTDQPSTSIIKFGPQMMMLVQTANGTWGTDHKVTLSNLQPNTAYFFQVQSGQAAGAANATKGPVEQFKTLAPGAPVQANAPCCPVFGH